MSATEVLVLNGVNLGRLGFRDPAVYGSTTYAQLADRLRLRGLEWGLAVDVRQTDDEAEMIGWLHGAAESSTPVVLNPAAWSHYSVALRDAASQLSAPLIEVHISNIHAREEFRHHSVISGVATGVIAGLGIDGYELALQFVARTVAAAHTAPANAAADVIDTTRAIDTAPGTIDNAPGEIDTAPDAIGRAPSTIDNAPGPA